MILNHEGGREGDIISDNFARDVACLVQELLSEEHVETSLSCKTNNHPDSCGLWKLTLNKRMPGNLVEEFLQAESPLLDELRLEDAVVAGDEGKLLGEGLAREGGHHDLNCPGQLISQPLHPQYKLHFLSLIYI